MKKNFYVLFTLKSYKNIYRRLTVSFFSNSMHRNYISFTGIFLLIYVFLSPINHALHANACPFLGGYFHRLCDIHLYNCNRIYCIYLSHRYSWSHPCHPRKNRRHILVVLCRLHFASNIPVQHQLENPKSNGFGYLFPLEVPSKHAKIYRQCRNIWTPFYWWSIWQIMPMRWSLLPLNASSLWKTTSEKLTICTMHINFSCLPCGGRLYWTSNNETYWTNKWYFF